MAKLFHRTPGGNVPHPGNRLRPLERHSDGAELGRYGLYHGTFRPGVQGYVAAFGGAVQAPDGREYHPWRQSCPQVDGR